MAVLVVQPSVGKSCRPTGLHRNSRKPRVGVSLSILAIGRWKQKRQQIKNAALEEPFFEGETASKASETPEKTGGKS